MIMAELAIQPVLRHPRQAETGRRYVFTVDLKVPAGHSWPDPKREEITFYCMLDSWPLFRCESGSEPIILHRFGGSYGPARFVLTASEEESRGKVSITLVNEWGAPLTVLETDEIEVFQNQYDASTELSEADRRIKNAIS